MADDKKQSGNVGGTLGMVVGLISAATPLIVDILDKFPSKQESNHKSEELVTVPEIYKKGFPLTLEQASAKLESESFKIIPSQLTVTEAKPAYKDCFNLQVIDSDPKSKQKVKPGTMVVVRYITQDVIDESQRLFEETEKQKEAVKEARAAKRSEQIERTKEVAAGVSDKAMAGLEKIVPHRGHKRRGTRKELPDEQE